MPEFPFAWRISALLLFSAAAVALDRRHPPEQRTRWREYSVLCLGTSIGIVFGVAVDSITSSISPDYFVHGKWITSGPGFRSQVLLLGAKAGSSAGVIGTAVLLIANPHPKRAFVASRLIWLPVVGAASLGSLFGVIQSQSGLMRWSAEHALLGERRALLFETVWAAHLGVYVGALSGLTSAVVLLRRTRMKISE